MPGGPNNRKTLLPVPRKPELRGVRAAPSPHRPPSVSSVTQPKTNPSTRRAQPAANVFQKKAQNAAARSHKPATSVITRQMSKSSVVQAVKIYPNLHPGAVEPVNQGSLFHLNNFAGQYRLHRKQSHSVNVPNQQYNFVRTREGEMLLHNRYRHPSIAEGKQVLYAGEIFFNNGQLQWWSNGSGHYQPNAEDAEQANLPMDQFFSYQQVIKGEHRKKR